MLLYKSTCVKAKRIDLNVKRPLRTFANTFCRFFSMVIIFCWRKISLQTSSPPKRIDLKVKGDRTKKLKTFSRFLNSAESLQSLGQRRSKNNFHFNKIFSFLQTAERKAVQGALLITAVSRNFLRVTAQIQQLDKQKTTQGRKTLCGMLDRQT